jgi:ParB/RepB/Spo0J family partition protein
MTTTLTDPPVTLKPIVISLQDIHASATNPRKTFNEDGLKELAESITKHGVLMPILVRKSPSHADDRHATSPQYEIIAGERRYRASKIAGYSTAPVRVIKANDLEVLELQIIENLQREDLHPLEEAESYEALLKAHAGNESYGVDEVAAKLGKSRGYIYARMKLCALPPEARQAFYDGKLTASTALLIARIPVPELQIKALGEITRENYDGAMSFRTAANHIQNNYMLRLDQAKFKISDATLLPNAGPCTTCPKRTGANPDLFDDVGRADVCTDPTCFADKKAAHGERLRIAAVESGKKVITGKQAKQIKPDRWSEPKGYLKPDDSPWWLASQDSLKTVLGKALPETVLLEDPHSGEMIELIPEDKTRDALKSAGHKLSRALSPSAANDRAQEAKAKAERVYRRAVLRAIHDTASARVRDGETLTSFDLQLIAEHAFERLGSDSRPVVAELWGWPSKDLQAGIDAIGALSPNDLAILLMDIALAGRTYVSSWWSGDESEDLQETAARYGVDVKAIKRQLAPAKKPAAPKKAAPTKKAAASSAAPAVKYRNVDTGATWSGRGKPPRWILDAEEAGHIREEFLTQEAALQIGIDSSLPAQPQPNAEAHPAELQESMA